MAYSKQTWIDNSSVANATRLGHIEDGIADAAANADSALAQLAAMPAATTSAQGEVELATTTEAAAGVDTTRAVTPAGVAAALAALPVSIANLPAGAVIATSTTTRPSARSDLICIFTGSDPGSAAIDNVDLWIAP